MSVLDSIRHREAAATEGPWAVEHDEDAIDGSAVYVDDGITWGRSYVCQAMQQGLDEGEADAEFIAHARADIPRLLGALDAVLALHEPVDALMYGGRSQAHKVQVCVGCGQDDGNWNSWPCPTVAAVNDALEAGK